ncbi:hypothetical protein MMC15_003551 [Xylographa vitiligo]|nr:hypothetical protein [Xylographa vitiligo]
MLSTVRFSTATILYCLVSLGWSATVTYDFNITWVTSNPDGAYERSTIGINGQWPLPAIRATVGDQVVVNVMNQLGNETTSLHFHGIYQTDSPEMDGTTGVSQCAIPPGASLTYNFLVEQPGTYWYHSHAIGQYPDGLRGPFIVHDPASPFMDMYDEEIVLTLSDWYHESMAVLIPSFLSVANPTGAEPIPDAALLNDAQNITVSVEPGKTYMIRVINMGAFVGQYLWFEDHSMTIIEVDGIYTEPAVTEMLYLSVAQRYSVLLTTKNDTLSNFAFVGSMDQDMFDHVPPGLNPNATGWLVYNKSEELPSPAILGNFYPFDDFTLIPHDGEALLENVDHSILLNFMMGNLDNGANYGMFNDVTYVTPVVPTLYTVLSAGDAADDVAIYGSNTNAFILEKDEVVEIVLNSADTGKHPFHLHGHNFQVAARSAVDAGAYAGNVSLSQIPMRRDTFMVNPGGYVVLRFKANNPDKSRPIRNPDLRLLTYLYGFGYSTVTLNGIWTRALSPQ